MSSEAQKSLAQKESIPDCNSFDCRKGTAAADLAQKKSIPDCNSFDCRTKTVGIEESWIPNGPRFSLAQQEKESIPACDSYDGCKTKTAAAPLMQVSNPGNKWQCDQDPGCRRYMSSEA
jgi:hypothetical protein